MSEHAPTSRGEVDLTFEIRSDPPKPITLNPVELEKLLSSAQGSIRRVEGGIEFLGPDGQSQGKSLIDSDGRKTFEYPDGRVKHDRYPPVKFTPEFLKRARLQQARLQAQEENNWPKTGAT